MYITHILPTEVHTSAFWSVLTPCDHHGDSELENFFKMRMGHYRKDITGMFALLKQVSEEGPQNLNDKLCHHLGDGIREFRKGRIRVLWFYDEGKVIICSHALLKTSQKIKAADILKAKHCRDQYMTSKRSNALTFIEGD